MQRRSLGMTEVPTVGLGCMGFSFAFTEDPRSDRPEDVIHEALDVGASLFDTADIYGDNELILGQALKGRRDEAFIATKCGLSKTQDLPLITVPDGRPEHIRASIDNSLQRLGVDVVDLFQLHYFDPDVPVAETWGAMYEVVAAGEGRRHRRQQCHGRAARDRPRDPPGGFMPVRALAVEPGATGRRSAVVHRPWRHIYRLLSARAGVSRRDDPSGRGLVRRDGPPVLPGTVQRRCDRQEIRTSSMSSGTWEIVSAPARPRSRSRGYSPRLPASSPFRARDGSSACGRMQRRRICT
jgi:hypothetical protein